MRVQPATICAIVLGIILLGVMVGIGVLSARQNRLYQQQTGDGVKMYSSKPQDVRFVPRSAFLVTPPELPPYQKAITGQADGPLEVVIPSTHNPPPAGQYFPLVFMIDGTSVHADISISITLASQAPMKMVKNQPLAHAAVFWVLFSKPPGELTVTIAPPGFSAITIGPYNLAALKPFQLPGAGQLSKKIQVGTGPQNTVFSVPPSNFLVLPGALYRDNVPKNYPSFTPAMPKFLNGDPPLPVGGQLSLAALGGPQRAVLSTAKNAPVLLSGLTRPGSEACPSGAFHFPMYTPGMLNDYSLFAQFTSMTQWGANCVRLPLNQQFWLSGCTYSFTGELYQDFYQRFVMNAIYTARAAGVPYIILVLAASDCGLNNVSEINTKQQASGRYGAVGPQMLPDTNSVAFWAGVAATLPLDHFPDVIFELYNEPDPVETTTAATWAAWQSGAALPTAGLDTTAPQISVPKGAWAYSASTKSVTITTPGYVGMQDLLNVVRAVDGGSQSRLCIVSGVSRGFVLNGVYTNNFQYALTTGSAVLTPAANVLYSAHADTSSLGAPTYVSPAGYCQFDYSLMDAAFGGMAQFSDFIASQYGNDGSGSAAPAAGQNVSQQAIQRYLDQQVVQYQQNGSVKTTQLGIVASCVAGMWFPDTAIALVGGNQTSTEKEVSWALSTGLQKGGNGSVQLACMGEPVRASLLWRRSCLFNASPPYPAALHPCSSFTDL
jgi:hypothetical protein